MIETEVITVTEKQENTNCEPGMVAKEWEGAAESLRKRSIEEAAEAILEENMEAFLELAK